MSRLIRPIAAFLLLWVIGLGSALADTVYLYSSDQGVSIAIGDYEPSAAGLEQAMMDINGGLGCEYSGPGYCRTTCAYAPCTTTYGLSGRVFTQWTPDGDDLCTVNPDAEICAPVCDGENETTDPVDGSCVCEDGFSRDENNMCSADNPVDPEPNTCGSSDECLSEVEAICAASGAFVMDYQYFGGGQYGYACGIDLGSCEPGQAWNVATQLCVIDTDGDGIGDAFDPEPENPDVNGDTDGDGVPDSQDSDPTNPDVWNGPDLSGQPITIGNRVDPVGPSIDFNDSAIVGAINETISQNNTTNSLLDDLQNTGAVGNDIAADGFSSVLDGLSANNAALNGISDQLEPVDGDAITTQITDLVNSSASELGVPEITDSDSSFISSSGAIFTTAQCNNPSFNGHSIDLCSLQARIVPLAEWVLWLLTVMFCYHEFHSVLRRD